MGVKFFIDYEGTTLQLPVNPTEIKVRSDSGNKLEEIINLGEITLMRTRKLQTLAIESFLPSSPDAPYIISPTFLPPDDYINFFMQIRDSKKPCRLTITDTKINMLMTVENIEYGYYAGDPDIRYTLNLREHRVLIGPLPNKANAEPERPKTGYAIGDKVIITGYTARFSNGSAMWGYVNKFVGEITFIDTDKTAEYPYQIKDSKTGETKGWVKESQIQQR